MRENNAGFIGKIIVSIVIFNLCVLISWGILNVALKNLYNTDEKNGVLAYELQQLYLMDNAELEEFEFINIRYINRNVLHCKVNNINEKYNLDEHLKNKGWTFNGKYYIKNNLVSVITRNTNSLVLELYYK